MSTTYTAATEIFAPHLRALGQLAPAVRARAVEQGLQILAEAGHPRAALTERDFRVPHEVVMRLLDNALSVSGDPTFALKAGGLAERGDFGLFDVLTLAAPTLGESMRLAGRFISLLHDAAGVEVEHRGPLTFWHHTLPPGVEMPPAGNDYVISAFYKAALTGLGFHTPPTEVHFTHARPTYADAYREVFNAPVHFDRPTNALVLPRLALDLPLVTSDPALLAVLLRYGEQALSTVPRTRPFTREVRQFIADDLAARCHLTEVASALHLSETTVQRRLQAEGTSHTDLVDGLRRERALELLADPQLHVSEVAYLLGFSHRPAFHRAFKRWFGMSPSQHRKQAPTNPLLRFYTST